MISKKDFKKINDWLWEIPRSFRADMRVPARAYISEEMFESVFRDRSISQLINVASLPGIINYSIAMPDMHEGYGFCLSPKTKILSNFGYYLPIKKFQKIWHSRLLRSFDFKLQKVTETPIQKFLKIKPKNKVLNIITKTGKEITATEDHPFYTPNGMVQLRKLNLGDQLAVFPFEGISYEQPSSRTIINEKDIKKVLVKTGIEEGSHRFKIILDKLKKRNLIPLTYNHPKTPYILKIMGFVFGDASMNFIGKRGDGVFHFAGKSEDLEEARRDLKKIGYTPSPVHYRRRKDPRSGRYHDSYSFLLNASSFVVFLEALGVPRGSKVGQPFRIPKWIFKAPLWQKRLFLAALFGSELRCPHRRLDRRGNFNAPSFTVGKRENLIENAREYLNDISKLLKEFGVRTLYIEQPKNKRHINTGGQVSWGLNLVISPSLENLLNLWGKVGFEHNEERSLFANVAVHYLRTKQKFLKEKEDAIKLKIPPLLKLGLSYQKIANQLATANPLTKRFIVDVCWKLNKGVKRINPRINSRFPLFKDYLKKYTQNLEKSGMVWDEIVAIKEISYKGWVYDFTVTHPDHNFIANNFVVSNCIGGVAATRLEDGVISPGGVGYDINCLHPDSKINLSFGTRLPIFKLVKYWKSLSVILMRKTDKKLENVPIVNFLSRKEDKFLYNIKTKSGFEIKATDDHPLYNGIEMKKAEKLEIGEKLVLYPFSGINYEEPSNREIINKEKVYTALRELNLSNKGNRYPQIVKWFKERDLINLRYNSWQIPYLIKVLGYLFGDGTVNFIGRDRQGQISFYGKLNDLKNIKNDLNKIGIATFIYSRKRNHKINTFYKTYQFSYTEHSLNSRSSSLALLLYLLGAPLGNKTNQKFSIPKWLWRAPLWQKRLFLASFFGAELSKPATLNKYNFYSPTLNINKALLFKNNGIAFLNELRKILTEFGVKSSKIVEVEELSKSGKTIGLRFQIFGNIKNLLNFFQWVGFEYNLEKQKLSCLAIGFLKQKKEILTLRTRIRELARNLYYQGVPAKKIVSDYETEFLGKRFIEHSIWSSRGEPRIAFNFPSFEEYIKTHRFGDYGLITDEIEEIKKENYKGLVYDFTVNHQDHNFIADNFVVSNCGMRLLKSDYLEKDIKPSLDKIATEIQKEVPSGLGRGRQVKIDIKSLEQVLEGGAQRLIEQGYGEKEDLENCESQGRLSQAGASYVSDRAKNRGRDQVGTLGSGNHFLEIQRVAEVFDEETARVFGLFQDQVVIMIHTGSRGLGHQIATDYIRVMMQAMPKYKINLPDRELAACPINSPEGKEYFAAMSAGANYAWANRQMIAHFVRKAWKTVLGDKASPLILLYDVAHNIAKIEKHEIGGKEIEVCLHRKGATRAFPPDHPEIPLTYQKVGQPVIIPGSMGTASYILAGQSTGKDAFFSTAHGAGRTMSRREATRRISGQEVINKLKQKGIIVKCWSSRGIAEEAPLAYKDVDSVVDVVHQAGLSKKVVKLVPLAVIKGE